MPPAVRATPLRKSRRVIGQFMPSFRSFFLFASSVMPSPFCLQSRPLLPGFEIVKADRLNLQRHAPAYYRKRRGRQYIMRGAIVSDVHGKWRALEAVLAGLQQVAPDVVFHGGDLAAGGAHPAEVIDQIRSLGWPGVRGNTDEMLWSPRSLNEFDDKTPQVK